MRIRLFVAVVMAVSLTAAGCSSDSDDAAEVSDTSATSNSVTTATSETTATSAAATTTTTTTTVKNTTTSVVVDADQVAIKTDSDFSSEPIHGTFEVTEGADILGCSNGTYVDTPPVGEFDPKVNEINKVLTCSEPDTGTFTIAFVPDGYDTGPGVLNGPWRILNGSDGFADLQGEGDHWLVMEGPKTGVETYAGNIADISEPADVINDHMAAYNSGDIDEIMTFFSDESVITGHPYPIEARGLDGIRELHVADRQAAAVEDPWLISNLEVADDTVTWNQVWVSSTGQEFCHEGQSAVVKDGIILFWDWSSGSNCA